MYDFPSIGNSAQLLSGSANCDDFTRRVLQNYMYDNTIVYYNYCLCSYINMTENR
jgi:hypothetical protein